ncbi:MAG: alpha/beta hydrolase [Thiothrix sp.]|nr:MAG: alpha/beta hydrolase [Thiothrix sp.]
MREFVICIHGIWMTGLEMQVLRSRIARCGFKTAQFRYRSLRLTPKENAVQLNQFLLNLEADVVHLVAHSLGGLVVTHLFDQFPLQRPGRIVMLGTPLKGSATAHAYHTFLPTRPLLGRSTSRGLLGDRPRWKGVRELGVIAGDRGFGIGQLTFGKLPSPNDGTVALDETRSAEVHHHLTVPHSHFGMIYSKDVAEAVCHFLKEGEF